jgi:hypothetical protein
LSARAVANHPIVITKAASTVRWISYFLLRATGSSRSKKYSIGALPPAACPHLPSPVTALAGCTHVTLERGKLELPGRNWGTERTPRCAAVNVYRKAGQIQK